MRGICVLDSSYRTLMISRSPDVAPAPLDSKAPLRRNKACSCCRKKKMKCDGLRPICTPCVKSNRVGCAYEEKKPLNRTQLLESKISRLETRLQELESDQSQPSISPPDTTSFSSPSSSATSSPHPWAAGRSRDIQFHDGPSSLSIDTALCDSTRPSGPSRRVSNILMTPYNLDNSELLTNEEQISLVKAFITHQHQWNTNFDPGTFPSSLHVSPSSLQPHPALLNAVYLISASQFPPSPYSSKLSDEFLRRALSAISYSLELADRLADVVQASCLLATFFYTRGRIQEGYCHSTAAVRLVEALCFDTKLSVPGILECATEARAGKAVPFSIFYQVFAVDKGWSVATGLPSAIGDDDNWIISETHSRAFDSLASIDDRSLAVGVPQRCVGDILVLKLKAYAFYELSNRITTRCNISGEALRQQKEAVSSSLTCFASTFSPFVRRSPTEGRLYALELHLVVIHILIFTAVIHLERNLVESDTASFRKCVVAVHSITAVIHQLGQGDYDYLDPILSSCWHTAGQLCAHVMTKFPQSGTRPLFCTYLDNIISAMKLLAIVFPCSDSQVRGLERICDANGLR